MPRLLSQANLKSLSVVQSENNIAKQRKEAWIGRTIQPNDDLLYKRYNQVSARTCHDELASNGNG